MGEEISFSSLGCQFDRAYNRSREERATGKLSVWIWMLRGMCRRLEERVDAREKELYQQLMLLEEDVAAGRDKAAILERIGRAKGILTAVFLGLVLQGVVLGAVGAGESLRRPPTAVRVVRTREEVAG